MMSSWSNYLRPNLVMRKFPSLVFSNLCSIDYTLLAYMISNIRKAMRVLETRSASLFGRPPCPFYMRALLTAALFSVRNPDNSKIKHKMLYASSKDAIRKSLVGISTEVQGTDLSEVAYETG